MKYFYIDDIKFNYSLEFDALNPKNKWKLNAPLIEYCETLGIKIPHYCYHKNLSIAGNCRMCLIELKKSPKPIVSCAMNARSILAANSVVYTNSPLIKKARENILEFLLLNHPLDCPICDQGGECDLQDQSLFFGVTKKRFYNFRRIVINKNIGPIVKTVMTRCIHCTRCVRFATEIAGVENLGVFGRGVKSEIGTYITKVFQSELSGNVIDLCPVGALTSKPYPFIGRSWELKSVNSIDVSDGFGVDIQVLLKNNRIIKILPGYNSQENDNNWISDKTRFLFDGMFSPDRKLTKTVISGSNCLSEIGTWNQILKKLVYSIYFYDHLNRYFFEINPIIFVFGEDTPVEVLNILMLINKKFNFFKLRRLKQLNTYNDFEAPIQLKSATKQEDLDKADVCLLIGTNPKYDGSYLNLKIRKRLSKGNFKIFKFGSVSDLTFSTASVGTNLNTLKSIAEGSHSICQNLKEAKNLLIILNSDLYERKDASFITNLIQTLKSTTSLKNGTWNGFNFLNNSLNSVGINLLNNFKALNKRDFYDANALYFINANTNTTYFDMFIELKLLNYLTTPSQNKILIEQNSKITNISQVSKTTMNLYNYIYLPSNVFFESLGTYINTEGSLKKSVKIVSSKKNTKDHWQILRKLYSLTENIFFISNPDLNTQIQFNCSSMSNFKNFTNLMYLNTLRLSKLASYTTNKNNQSFELPTYLFNTKRSLLNLTTLKKQISDFYIGGSDNYSRSSTTMLDCSNILRSEKTNF